MRGPNGYSFSSPPVPVLSSADSSLDGTWKVLLPQRSAGFGYTVVASCAGCSNVTAPPATLSDVGFGDVYLCSGQSNMEVPVLTTVARFETYEQTAAGDYDHVRLFQTGWRYVGAKNTSSWILPPLCQPSGKNACGNNTEPHSPNGGYAYRSWLLPRSPSSQSDDDSGQDVSHFPDRFSAACWYFGKALADLMRASAPPGGDPVPLGLIASTIGGTTIQEWLPPSATGNSTCTENNCGWVQQPAPALPPCTSANASTVWSCPSAMCSTLWHSMIAPFVNMSIAGAIWYQGEQNVVFGRGSASSGYQCQQAALVRSWREAFSALPGTSAPDFPFGIVSLAGGASEGAYDWSPFQHVPQAQWDACQKSNHRSPFCAELPKEWTAGLRAAQTGGYGYTPNAALPNVFLGQNYDQGEPCLCDAKLQAPDGCWATNACFGEGYFSL